MSTAEWHHQRLQVSAHFGCLEQSHSQIAEHDLFLRRTAFKDRNGLTLDYDINALIQRSVPYSKLPDAAQKAWAHKATTDTAQMEMELEAA